MVYVPNRGAAMPIYEFVCTACQKTFDQLCSMKTDLSTIACPFCAALKVTKKMSTFATGNSGGSSFDLGDSGGHSHSSGGGCGSCSSHSCGTCSH
jgi:putative FmdB family regulatory protein